MLNEAVVEQINVAHSIQSVDDKLAVFTAYGWEQGEIGNLSDARIEALANQAITATPLIPDPAWRYPALSTPSPRLRGEGRGEGSAFPLAIVNAIQPLATAQAVTAARDLALGKLETMNDCVECTPHMSPKRERGTSSNFPRSRFGLVWASDDEDQTPELAQTAEQPRRDRGEAEPEPFPDPAGTATFNAATSTLSVPALPAHATSLRAFRKPLRGTAELAGTSTTTSVSPGAPGPARSSPV